MTRFSRLSRGAVSAVALAVLTLATSACNKGLAPAATVNGHDIPAEHLLEGARIYGKLPIDPAGTVTNTTGQKVPITLVAGYLNQLVEWRLIHEVAVANKVTVTDAQRAKATTSLQGQLTGTNGTITWKKIPGWFQKQLVEVSAELDALSTKLAAGDDGTAAARATYNADKASYTVFCVDAMATGKEADATAAVAKIRAGSSFSSVAQAQATKDGGKAGGVKADGYLGCKSLSELQTNYGFDSATLKNLAASADGDLLGPISYQGAAYLVVKVRSHRVPSFDEVKAQILASQSAPGQAKMSALITKAILAARVEVNPRYGTWSTSGTQPGVKGPAGAETATSAATATTTPVVATSN